MAIDYDNRERSYELFRKGKVEGTWDPDDFEFERDKEDWAAFSEQERQHFLQLASGFYDGEENVTRTLAPYMMALDALDNEKVPFDTVQEEMYLSQQVYEEAKHTDFFSRYYEAVFETQATEEYRETDREGYGTEDLFDQADELRAAIEQGDHRNLVHTLGLAYMNYMGIIEGQLARAGYYAFDMMAESKADEMGRETVLPGYQDALSKIRQDETRHIENGRWVLQQLAEHDPSVVSEVYEPRMMDYIDARILTDESAFDASEAYDSFDNDFIGKRVVQHLQDTVDYIGAEKFDELGDVQGTIESLQEQRRAAADD